MGNETSGQRGVAEKETELTVSRKPSKPMVKRRFWAGSLNGTGTQAGGRRRGTMDTAGGSFKNPGKTKASHRGAAESLCQPDVHGETRQGHEFDAHGLFENSTFHDIYK